MVLNNQLLCSEIPNSTPLLNVASHVNSALFRVVRGTTLKFVYDIGSSSFAAFAQSSYSLFSSHTYYFVRRRRPHVLFFRQHNNNNRD